MWFNGQALFERGRGGLARRLNEDATHRPAVAAQHGTPASPPKSVSMGGFSRTQTCGRTSCQTARSASSSHTSERKDAGRERSREGVARSATQRSKEDVRCKRAVELGDVTVYRPAAGRAASPRSPGSVTPIRTSGIVAFHHGF